jgi:hypothetical protein
MLRANDIGQSFGTLLLYDHTIRGVDHAPFRHFKDALA